MNPLVIKRYPNRKLYDTEAKRYVTLNDIADLIQQGQEVQVVDNNTQEDLTAVTLTQIIFEQEKKQGGFLPTAVLRGLVQSGGETLNAIRQNLVSPLDLLRHIDEEIERRLQMLIHQGDLAKEEGLRLRNQLLSHGHRLQESLWPAEPDLEKLLKQQGIPSRQEFEALNQQIDLLTAKLDQLIGDESNSQTDA